MATIRAEIGSFGHRSRYVAPYVRIKARRGGAAADSTAAARGLDTIVLAGNREHNAMPGGRCNPPSARSR